MSERPIIFSAPMVRAILAGQKTMTRRLATSPLRKCGPGDLLWVRESGWWTVGTDHISENKPKVGITCYRATFNRERSPAVDGKWRPSIHMPRWASRITLRVTGVKIERLQDISEEDAVAEGSQTPLAELPKAAQVAAWSERGAFANIWNAIHGPGAWDANPEVVAISFQRASDPDHPPVQSP